MYAGEEADEWELDGMAAVTRNPYARAKRISSVVTWTWPI